MNVVNTLFSFLADLLYAPLVRAHIKEIALNAPLFPGQIWTLPMLSNVRILRVNNYSVTYTLLETEYDGEEYVCSRSVFIVHGRIPTVSNEVTKLNVIQFPSRNNTKE